MIDDGLYKKIPKPDVVLAQYAMRMKAGTVSIRLGHLLTAADALAIRIYGWGRRGSAPQTRVDPIIISTSIVTRLQTIMSREVTPSKLAVVSHGSIQAGHTANIIPDQLDLKLNIRTYSTDVRGRVLTSNKKIIKAECEAAGVVKRPSITTISSAPATIKDRATVQALRGTFSSYFKDNLVKSEPAVASEDFSLLTTVVGAPCVI